jgi:hypothetical protein
MTSAPEPTLGSNPTKKELGAFYTPDSVVDYMVKQLSVANLSGRILEPSGGDGAIVRGVLRAGVHPDQITVWDINPEVKKNLEDLEVSVHIGDALAREATSGAYHAVVGNPPYLNKQSEYIKSNRDWLKKRYISIGANDTYAMFAWQAVQNLAPGGQLVFLISDTFFSLGVHKKFRQWLLTNTRIDSLTLLPKDTFPGAAVKTVILSLTLGTASEGHAIKIVDARKSGISKLPKPTLVPQAEILKTPGQVFLVNQVDREDLAFAATLPSLMGILDGGLGMFTKNNAEFLTVISDSGVPRSPVRKGQQTIDLAKVDGITWRAYHKRGGETRWSAPVEHAILWTENARNQYTTPQSATAGKTAEGKDRQGVAVSGIASRLSARMAHLGSMWESNKVFVLFPKDPSTNTPLFLLAILNSERYNKLASLLNHTVSLQIRDLRSLPLLPFTAQEKMDLASHSAAAIESIREGIGTAEPQSQIDKIVENAWNRCRSQALDVPDA